MDTTEPTEPAVCATGMDVWSGTDATMHSPPAMLDEVNEDVVFEDGKTRWWAVPLPTADAVAVDGFANVYRKWEMTLLVIK